MRASLRRCSLLVAGLAGSMWACFEGTGALGAVCFDNNQCGPEQQCVNSICGLCNDRLVQAGELCFGNSSEENVFGEVSDLLAYTPDENSFPLLVAMVNNNCEQPPMQGPPGIDGPVCWGIFALDVDDDGDFEATTPLGTNNDGRVPQIGAGDFDNLGTLDVALAINPNDQLADPTAIVVIYDFGSPNPIVVDFDISLQARSLYAADMNGDGLDDLLISGELSSTLALFLADPDASGGFAAERLLVSDPTPRPAAPVDMDNDGNLDIVVLSEIEATVGVDLNDGNGNFSPAPRETIDDPDLRPQQIATADFDQDGNVDVVVFVAAAFDQVAVEPEVRVYRGLGDGSLELNDILPGGEFPVSGLTADINNDGWPDIIVADIQEDKLPVHINRGGTFPDIVRIDVAASPRELMYADFDFDDIPDLVVGNANGVVAVVPSEN